MTTPDNIPEDILQAATAVEDQILAADVHDVDTQIIIAKAILAERERCALVAEFPGLVPVEISGGIRNGLVFGPEIKAIADRIELKMTCSAFPEQYDASLDGEQVGYLRLRHGAFTVEYPCVGGKPLVDACPNGDGAFDDDERDHWLSAAKLAIAHAVIRKGGA